MPQLKTLILFKASPIALPDALLSSSVKRAVTLPSLTHFEMTPFARDCGLALAHLVLPALITLRIIAESCYLDGSDVPELLPHVARHAHGPQHTQPIQSAFVRSQSIGVEIFAWSERDVDMPNDSPFFGTMYSARVELSLMNIKWSPGTHTSVFDAVMAALPLSSLMELTTEKSTRLNKQFWLRHTPQWPLLRCMRLGNCAARGFREMLLAEDDGGRESPLLPSLTKLVLVNSELSVIRTLHLCDALMKRVEQGVPLETLDLSTCLASSHSFGLLSEIVVEVLGPEEALDSEPESQMISRRNSTTRGRFVEDSNSEVEDYYEDDLDSENDDDEWDDEETDDDPPDWESELPWWPMDSEEA
jgi:hypothetical protein